MAINESSDKFRRCQEACLDHLRSIHPNFVGHRKVAIVLLDPYRGTGRGVKRETFCDEMTRRALNALVAEGRIATRTNAYAGLRMKVFGWSQV